MYHQSGYSWARPSLKQALTANRTHVQLHNPIQACWAMLLFNSNQARLASARMAVAVVGDMLPNGSISNRLDDSSELS